MRLATLILCIGCDATTSELAGDWLATDDEIAEVCRGSLRPRELRVRIGETGSWCLVLDELDGASHDDCNDVASLVGARLDIYAGQLVGVDELPEVPFASFDAEVAVTEPAPRSVEVSLSVQGAGAARRMGLRTTSNVCTPFDLSTPPEDNWPVSGNHVSWLRKVEAR